MGYAYTGISAQQVRDDIDTHIDEIIAALTTPLQEEVDSEFLFEKIATQAGYRTPWGIVEPGPVDDELITFTGSTYDEAYEALQKSFLDWGWGDGFPLVPPTRERVEEMLTGTSHAPNEELTDNFYPVGGLATVEMIAIQAVMAGAKPEHFPVILAATQCMINVGQRFIIMAQSTSPHAPFFWLNGPIIKEIGVNYGIGTLGPGAQSRVNIAIGRASRLIMMNIGGAYLGVKDMDTIGTPDKFSQVTAEDEDHIATLGWEPYHVTKGFKSTDSTISMITPDSHSDIMSMSSSSAKGILMWLADEVGRLGTGSSLILLSGDTARLCVDQGFATRESIAQFIADNVKIDRESYIEFYSHGEERVKERLEAFLKTHPEDYFTMADLMAVSPMSPPGATAGRMIQVLRVGAFAGKDQAYKVGGSPMPVSIDEWR